MKSAGKDRLLIKLRPVSTTEGNWCPTVWVQMAPAQYRAVRLPLGVLPDAQAVH